MSGARLLLRAGHQAPWSPHVLSRSVIYGMWDADYTNLITLDGSGNGQSWKDVIGNVDAAQSTTASRPPYSATAINGRPGFIFDGAVTCFNLASLPFPTGATPCEMWALARNDDAVGATQRYILGYGGSNSTSNRIIRHAGTTGAITAQISVGDGAAGQTATVSSPQFNGVHVIRGSVGATSSFVEIDGVASDPVAVIPSTGSVRGRIGSGSTSSVANVWTGAISFVAVTKPLSTAQAYEFRRYLATRGGI